jgi:excisionase family DNA binding protein
MTAQWLTVEDVAKELNVHPETVRIWIRERELNAVAFKRAYRIRRSDLDEFIRRHETMGDQSSKRE